MKKLDTRPARTDLTDRECSKIISSVIGGLCQMSDPETVRDAVRWIAENDELWQMARRQAEFIQKAMTDLAGRGV